ncbi:MULTISPECIES: hypothetical protein [unclassified Halorubrum]|uniref:hypothetical protein n=1 Tax=unclassified Halorubrum TaxID=2642239 RepID=UPI0010F71DBD|nr:MULTISPECIES: hypothetical protein [unclassified Halorubrum]TKX42651.1 hypothetical protein EXE50_13130 [Halorubrum sp. ARQ200]TKX51348.1 hypothetical protein EXE49_00195 [Halorubrum sp. ASP121]TKX58722.1 hypothetical protein EXE48_15770 [Halorubrum sp. ASP1]
MDSRLESLLLGKSLNLSLRYLGYSVILMALFFGQLYLVGNSGMGNSFDLLMSPLGVTVSAIILAGVHTHRNDGILVSIAVAVIIMSGSTLYTVISLNHPQPHYGILTGVGSAILYGIPIGIVSSTVAFALRRFFPTQSAVAETK